MTKKKVSIKQIAEELGISISTVSRALNDNPRISDSVKKRVLDKAKEYNYLAYHPINETSKLIYRSIAIVTPDQDSYSFMKIFEGVRDACLNYNFNILTISFDLNSERDIIQMSFSLPVCGIIICKTKLTEDVLSELNINKMPSLFIDAESNISNSPKIDIDHFNEGYFSAQHLFNNGCRNIAFLSGVPDNYIVKTQIDGINNFVERNNMFFKTIYSDLLEDDIKQSFLLLNRSEIVDGYIVQNPKTAIVLMRLINFYTINFQKRPKIISLEDHEMLIYHTPSITALQVPQKEIGKLSVEILNKHILNSELIKNGCFIMKSKIKVRSSSLDSK